MRVPFKLPSLPRHPLLRLLALAAAAIVLIGLVTLGFVVGAIVLAIAAVALVVRRWLSRRQQRRDPSIIEGEFTVVSPHPRVNLPHPE